MIITLFFPSFFDFQNFWTKIQFITTVTIGRVTDSGIAIFLGGLRTEILFFQWNFVWKERMAISSGRLFKIGRLRERFEIKAEGGSLINFKGSNKLKLIVCVQSPKTVSILTHLFTVFRNPQPTLAAWVITLVYEPQRGPVSTPPSHGCGKPSVVLAVRGHDIQRRVSPVTVP